MNQDTDELLDEVDKRTRYPNDNPKTLCDIFEEVIDLTDYGDSKDIDEYRCRLRAIARLMNDAKMFGEIRLEGRMRMLAALLDNGYWDCPTCGWTKISTEPYGVIECSRCKKPLRLVRGVWKAIV